MEPELAEAQAEGFIVSRLYKPTVEPGLALVGAAALKTGK